MLKRSPIIPNLPKICPTPTFNAPITNIGINILNLFPLERYKLYLNDSQKLPLLDIYIGIKYKIHICIRSIITTKIIIGIRISEKNLIWSVLDNLSIPRVKI